MTKQGNCGEQFSLDVSGIHRLVLLKRNGEMCKRLEVVSVVCYLSTSCETALFDLMSIGDVGHLE